MKHFYSILLAITAFPCLSFSQQWTTLYEGGTGAPNDLYMQWGQVYLFSEAGTTDSIYYTADATGINNGMEIFYYMSDFGMGTAGINRVIDNMEDYDSLRIVVESNLAPTDGVLHYTQLTNDQFYDSTTGAPLWDDFATDQIGVTIPFSNPEGHNAIYLYVDLLRGDSVYFQFNYIKIEGYIPPTTVGLSDNDNHGFFAYSSGKTIHVQAPNEEQSFTLQMYNALGAKVYTATANGSQQFILPCETGIYYAYISTEDGGVKSYKVLLE